MSALQQIRQKLEPSTVAKEVQLAHDRARISYQVRNVTVTSMEEFSSVLGDYYNHHMQATTGANLPDFEAQERAKEFVTSAYGSILSAYDRAEKGLHGGLHKVLDAVADGLREDATRRYVQNVIDTYVAPNDWNEQKRLVAELVPLLGMGNDRPAEIFAHDYRSFIDAYLKLLREADDRASRYPHA